MLLSLWVFYFSRLLNSLMSPLHPLFIKFRVLLIINQLPTFISNSMGLPILVNYHLHISFSLCIPFQVSFLLQKLLRIIWEKINCQIIDIKFFSFVPKLGSIFRRSGLYRCILDNFFSFMFLFFMVFIQYSFPLFWICYLFQNIPHMFWDFWLLRNNLLFDFFSSLQHSKFILFLFFFELFSNFFFFFLHLFVDLLFLSFVFQNIFLLFDCLPNFL